jgi:type IV secretory pathway VirD2 relaxase
MPLFSFGYGGAVMFGDDHDFQPRLGRMRSASGRRGKRFLNRVLAATVLANGGPVSFRARKARFDGSRIGRGAGVGRVLASRDQFAAYRQRRVIIKSRIVKLTGKGMAGARAHLRYIQRDGVTREGQAGQLYGADQDRVDGKPFLDCAEGDRHQFRFIVSAEDGDQYDDLKPLVRRLMAQMEQDLDTQLDWVAVDHHNTGHPHSHIIVRGKDDCGKDLIIAREYLTKGMRERTAEIVSLDLGPKTDAEVQGQLRREVEQERFTSLDRRLLRDQSPEHMVTGVDRDPFQQALCMGRLRKLERLGLAAEIRAGQWRLADDLETTLRRMGEHGDIIKTMHREMATQDLARAPADLIIHDPGTAGARPIIGRVVARGLSDEVNDRHYLIIDATDGRTHYVDIGKGEATESTPVGSILRVEPRPLEARPVDRRILEIAAANQGRYSIDIHLRHDPAASEAFAESHVRRLEAMRRLTNAVTREPDGTWIIAPNHLEHVVGYERAQTRFNPVNVRMLSTLPLEQQVAADGATWLDRELVTVNSELVRDAGFGRDIRDAQARRRQWLIAEGLAWEEQGGTFYRADMLATLRRRELLRVAGQLSDELGLGYVEMRPGQPVEGMLRHIVPLAGDKVAVIKRSRDFTLVPWRPVLDRHVGQQVAGIMRAEGISWAIGRQRSGPSVS